MRRMLGRVLVVFGVVLLLSLIVASVALASGGVANTGAQSYPLLWSALVSGILGPLAAYVVHTKLWKRLPPTVIDITVVVTAAIVSGITQAITAANFSFTNDGTYWTILLSVATAVAAHHGVWKTSAGARLLAPTASPRRRSAAKPGGQVH